MVLRFPYRSERQCPYCGCYDVARSRRRGFHESFFLLLRLRPYRCLECRKRFFGYAEAVRVEAPDEANKAA